MFSAEFADRARLTPTAFTRQRELPLPHLVGLLLNLRKGSLQDEVNGFWEVLTGQPMATGVSAAALCKARQKLDPYALCVLNARLLGAFAQAFPLTALAWPAGAGHGWFQPALALDPGGQRPLWGASRRVDDPPGAVVPIGGCTQWRGGGR